MSIDLLYLGFGDGVGFHLFEINHGWRMIAFNWNRSGKWWWLHVCGFETGMKRYI